MKDVLYHTKGWRRCYENTHLLKPLEDTELKTSIIGINPNWLTKPIMGKIFMPIVNDAEVHVLMEVLHSNYKCG